MTRDTVRLQARQLQEVLRWPTRVVRGQSSAMGAAWERGDSQGLDALAAVVAREMGGTPGPGRVS